jgi:hypothetical protein
MDATPKEIADIKQHIANLKNIDQPDFGLSSTMGDTTFAPVPDSQSSGGGFIFTNHRIKTTDDVRALVEYGPKALPFLLEALDANKTRDKQGEFNFHRYVFLERIGTQS